MKSLILGSPWLSQSVFQQWYGFNHRPGQVTALVLTTKLHRRGYTTKLLTGSVQIQGMATSDLGGGPNPRTSRPARGIRTPIPPGKLGGVRTPIPPGQPGGSTNPRTYRLARASPNPCTSRLAEGWSKPPHLPTSYGEPEPPYLPAS